MLVTTRQFATTPTFTVSGVLATLAVMAAAAGCVRLGFWQLDRLDQRRARNQQIESRLREDIVPLAASPADTTALTYRRVHVRGPLDHDRSIIFPGRSYRGVPGVHVLTPLRLDDGSAVLVNRGWVPAADGTSIDLTAFGLDRLEADGVVLPLPGAGETTRPPAAGMQAGEFQRIWFRVDPVALRRQFPYPVAPLEVRLLPEASRAVPPTRLPAPELDEGPHLGYAVQWFSFAAIALIGWCAMVVSSRSRR